MKLIAAAKQAGRKATEQKVAKADAAIQTKLDKAEEKIRASRDEALAKIESVAAELAQDVAGKVAGIKVGRDEAAKAVQAALPMANVEHGAPVAHTEVASRARRRTRGDRAWSSAPGGWVALAMLVVFAIMIWKKVPAAIGKALDKKIAAIREQLAEAECAPQGSRGAEGRISRPRPRQPTRKPRR